MIIKGQKIDGRYQIIRTIGEGGMANVYLAYDTILDREVAVKVLRGDLSSDDKFIKRFQREAKAASSLTHPNIVEMYDVGEDGGEHFIVMEYVDGRTLKSLIKKRGALSLTEVIDIMLQLTSAIACAHDSYLIHRDIKPQNVLILEDGRVKITDFGIAMALNSAELTQTNSVMGSVHYLPPEQANGSGSTIKSDIYSLGILMYELLIGKLPFKGENAVEIAIKQMKETIPSICSQNAIVPQSLENIVLRACAKNPKNRYNSVSEMHADLKTALSRDRQDEKRIVYQYPETDLDETKALDSLTSMAKEDLKDTRDEELEKEVKPSGKKGKKMKAAVLIGILLSILIFAGVCVAAIYLIQGTRTDTEVLPSIEGKSRESVETALNSRGIFVEFEEMPSDDIGEGLAIGYKDKRVGNKVKRGTTMTVYLSSGLTGVQIEDYLGQNVSVVQMDLEQKGLRVVLTSRKISISQEEYKDVQENHILEQNREPGTRLNEGGVIELIYAVLIEVYPDFTDINEKTTRRWTRSEAQAFCDDNGITCRFVDKVSTKTQGTLLSQNRAKDTEVKAGVTIEIEIAIPEPTPDPIPPLPNPDPDDE